MMNNEGSRNAGAASLSPQEIVERLRGHVRKLKNNYLLPRDIRVSVKLVGPRTIDITVFGLRHTDIWRPGRHHAPVGLTPRGQSIYVQLSALHAAYRGDPAAPRYDGAVRLRGLTTASANPDAERPALAS